MTVEKDLSSLLKEIDQMSNDNQMDFDDDSFLTLETVTHNNNYTPTHKWLIGDDKIIFNP